jgi:replicative DNA helicase
MIYIPANLDIEQFVLSSAIYDSQAAFEVSTKCTEEFFTDSFCRSLFRIISDLCDTGGVIDLVSLATRMPDSIEKLSDIANKPSTRNPGSSIEKLQELAIRRRVVTQTYKLLSDAQNNELNADDMILELLNLTDSCREFGTAQTTTVSIHDAITTGLSRIEKAATRKGLVGFSTGMKELDDMLSGIQPAWGVVIAGCSRNGKTVLALQLALAAASSGIGVLYYAFEQTPEILAIRSIGQIGEVSVHGMLSGTLPLKEYQKVSSAVSMLSKLPIWFESSPYFTSSSLKANVIAHQRTKNIGLIIVDHLQRIKGKGEIYEKMSSASLELTDFAHESGIPVVILSQITERLTDNKLHRPSMGTLKGSGDIGDNADVVILVYRRGLYDNEYPNTKAEIIVDKNKDGPTGTIQAKFIPDQMKFVSDDQGEFYDDEVMDKRNL